MYQTGERIVRDVLKGAVPAPARAGLPGCRRAALSTQIVVTDREPLGDARREEDVIVRVSVPAWGIVRVPAVTDRRVDQGRIAVEPVDGKPIATARSAPDIIRPAD